MCIRDSYFGVIRPEVSEFMKELDEELWKLGIPAKTKHNEVAPCQHELAPDVYKRQVHGLGQGQAVLDAVETGGQDQADDQIRVARGIGPAQLIPTNGSVAILKASAENG